MKFEKLGVEPRVNSILENSLRFVNATETQKQIIPKILEGKNVIGIAPSGTGKTIAFLAPIISQILNLKVELDSPICLIVAPTRELATQIENEAKILGKNSDIRILGIISHRPKNRILKKLKTRIDIIIGTPLKLLEYLNKGLLELVQVQMLVLDECDRLLEFGFYEIIIKLYEALKANKKLRIHLFSATLPHKMEKLANQIMNSPAKISVAKLKTSRKLKQLIYEVTLEEKLDVLTKILKDETIFSVIVFCRTKDAARTIAKHLLKEGLELEEMHGGLTDRQRKRALSNFEMGEVSALIATDLISRGINIDAVSHVINFDIPDIVEDYIHRVGRTARAGKSGTAINLVTPDDLYLIKKYQIILGVKIHRLKTLPRNLRKSNYEKKIELKKNIKLENDKRLEKEKYKKTYRKTGSGPKARYKDARWESKRTDNLNSQNKRLISQDINKFAHGRKNKKSSKSKDANKFFKSDDGRKNKKSSRSKGGNKSFKSDRRTYEKIRK